MESAPQTPCQSAVVGSLYDMLERDKRKAIEIIVNQKAEEQTPESADGDP